MGEKRRYFTPEKKMEILREHLKNKVPISELCEKYGICPTMFYKWEKTLFEKGLEIFSSGHRHINNKEHVKIRKLTEELHKKQEVIAWLTEENITLKKSLGEI